MRDKEYEPMMKTMILAASMVALVAISGQALAGTATAAAWRHSQASTNPQAMRAFNAVAPMTVEPNAHRYHGGPKVND
jgi:hypothetical protein